MCAEHKDRWRDGGVHGRKLPCLPLPLYSSTNVLLNPIPKADEDDGNKLEAHEEGPGRVPRAFYGG